MGVKSAQPSSTPCFLCFLQKHICWCTWKIATLTQDYTRFKNVLSAKYSEAKMYGKIVWISAALSTFIFEPLWSLYHGKKIQGKPPDFASIVNADVSCGHCTELAVLQGLETPARVGPGAWAGWLCAHTLPARPPTTRCPKWPDDRLPSEVAL